MNLDKMMYNFPRISPPVSCLCEAPGGKQPSDRSLLSLLMMVVFD
jgi:hypothetical protein